MFLIKQLLIGSGMIVLNLSIQIFWINWVMAYLKKKRIRHHGLGTQRDYNRTLYYIMSLLFIGHIMQFATWAILFRWGTDEFNGFEDPFFEAFYHSTVNFTSLGYGDFVMEQYKLLGALEAANGVLMFGLTAGLVLSVMTEMLKETRHGKEKDHGSS